MPTKDLAKLSIRVLLPTRRFDMAPAEMNTPNITPCSK